MIRKLLLLFVITFAFLTGHAQITSVAIVGEAAGGWPTSAPGEVDDNQMTTVDGVNWTLNDLVLTSPAALPDGGIKFRANNAWTINWGHPSNAFPSGTAVPNSGNILPIAGTYDVSFNSTTGVYSFTGGPVVPVVRILGSAVSEAEGLLMTTTNGTDYTLSNVTLADGDVHFDVDGQAYGGSTFPAGIASTGIENIPAMEGTYTVTFNITTGVYNFDYPSIGILGTVLGEDGFNGDDVDLVTIDGNIYQLNITLQDGELKFRQDNSWGINWGGPGLSGTAELNGDNIAVPAGDYLVSFNRNTLEYSITPSLSTKSSSLKLFSVYPNPTQNNWNFQSNNNVITDISIYDVTGKLVLNTAPKAFAANIDASALSSGMYFAKVASGNAGQTIKIIKE